MKTPEEWAKFEWENAMMKTEDFIMEIQKDAYNQAIDDAAKNAQSIIFTRNGKKSAAVKSNSILKLKIK